MATLTEQYTPWIHTITRRMYRKFRGYYEYQDLLGTAYLASVTAEKTYDPERGKFAAYIKPRIEGAINRSVSKVTGKQHRLLKKIYGYVDDYLALNGTVPTQQILTKHLGITDNEFENIIASAIPISIVSPESVSEEDMAVEATSDTDAQYAEVKEVIATLTPDQQERISEFMDGVEDPKANIKDILGIIRDRLEIKDKDERDY